MKRLEDLAATLFGFAFLGLAAMVAVETASRKLFNHSLQGVDELGGYVLAVGAALSFTVALLSRAHIRIDLVHERLPGAVRLILNALSLFALGASAAALAAMAWIALDESILFNATAQTPWATPLRWPQGVWFAALLGFVLAWGFEVARFALRARHGAEAVERDYGPRGTREEVADELADLRARGVVPGGVGP